MFPFDQHARPPDGIEVEFFGHPAWTFKSLAIIALATGAPVLPATSWREPDGRHVLRFEEPMAPIECENTNEAIRRNTRAYNAILEGLIAAPSRAVVLGAPAVEDAWRKNAPPPPRDAESTRARQSTLAGRAAERSQPPPCQTCSRACLAPKLIVLYVFIASAVYVHYRGRVRHGFFRQLTDHSSLMAPYNVLMYVFSAVPNRPYIDIAAFPELAPLRDNWQTIRDEGTAAVRRRPHPRRRPSTTTSASTRSSRAATSAST